MSGRGASKINIIETSLFAENLHVLGKLLKVNKLSEKGEDHFTTTRNKIFE